MSDNNNKRDLRTMTEAEMIGLLIAMQPNDMEQPNNIEDAPTADDYDVEMFQWDNSIQVDGNIAVGCNYTCICYEGQVAITFGGVINLFDEDGNPAVQGNDLLKGEEYLIKQGFYF